MKYWHYSMKTTTLRKATLFCFAASLVACAANAQDYSGKVYNDTNKNGQFDKGEKPLSGVLVTDGLNVVKTDKEGTFSLPGHPKARFIYITSPSGYMAPSKHYIPVSEKNDTYNFGLVTYVAEDAKGNHNFVQISDTEISDPNQGNWVKNLHDYAAAEKAAFIVHTGDICYEKGLNSHIQILNNESLTCPMYYCIGNHDLVKGKYGEELFESLYGPVFYSFETGNTHYIVTPMLGGDHAPSYRKEDVYKWMKNDLAHVSKDKTVMIFNHDLLTHGDTFVYGINDNEKINLNEHNLKAWLYGHWHINYIRKQGDVQAISTATVDKGGIDHSTSAYRVLHVDKKGNVSSELRYSYLDKNCRIASPQNNAITTPSANGSLPLSVNTYHSPAQTKAVTYTVEVNGKRMGEKQLTRNTDWNWSAEIPASGMKNGDEVKVVVTAQYNDGTTGSDISRFVYNAQPQVKAAANGNWCTLLGNTAMQGNTNATLDPASLQQTWIKNVGANIFMTSPLIVDGVVYIATIDEDLKGDGAVIALDFATGKELWRYATRNSIKNSIAYSKGNVFAQDAEGNLYAVNAKTGKLAWEKKLGVAALPCIVEGLTADNGIVYAGTGKGLCAVEAESGKELWVNKGWSQGEGTTSTISLGNGVVLMGSQWNALFGNDQKTGEKLWSISKDGMRFRASSPSVYNGRMYVTSEKSFFVVDPRSGEVIVRKEMPFSVDATSSPLVTDKLIIFGTVYNGLVALDKETYEVKWQHNIDPTLVYSSSYTKENGQTVETSPVLAGNTVYFAASDGSLYGVNAETGRREWKYTTGAPMFGSVAVSGNTLMAVDLSGNVYQFASK